MLSEPALLLDLPCADLSKHSHRDRNHECDGCACSKIEKVHERGLKQVLGGLEELR